MPKASVDEGGDSFADRSDERVGGDRSATGAERRPKNGRTARPMPDAARARTRYKRRMKWRAAGALLAMVAGSVLALPPADAMADQTCGPSHVWTLCLTVPDGALSGEVPISVSVSGKERDRLEKLIFTYRPSGGSSLELIRDFERPYGFVWPTDRELDETGVLAVQAESTSNDVGEKVRTTVTLANGNLGGIRRNPADWADRFHPQMPATGDPVIAAVGRGAMGKRVNDAVIESILARAPSLFLYLGEVYEFGTYASMRNWYGLADLDDPGGVGTAWGRMASYTAPTAGNHDTLEGTGPWLDYWHQRPLYTSFDFGGVHYVDLDSNCGQVGGCGATSKQYAFFKADLQANPLPCVVAYWNKTILSLDSFREGSSMAELWSLIAKNGGDMVLNAGGHGMEEWKPLNPALQAGRWNSHMVELNVSSGTDRWERVYRPDDRNAWEAYPQLGALSMTADGGSIGPATGLTWTFHDTAGATLRSNGVTC